MAAHQEPNGRDHVEATIVGQRIRLITHNLILVLLLLLLVVGVWVVWQAVSLRLQMHEDASVRLHETLDGYNARLAAQTELLSQRIALESAQIQQQVLKSTVLLVNQLRLHNHNTLHPDQALPLAITPGDGLEPPASPPKGP